MRNKLAMLLVLTSAVSIVVRVVYAEVKKGDYRPAELGSLQQPAPAEFAPDSNYQVAAYSVPTLELAPGEGRQEVQIYCNTCHSPRYITMQPPLSAAAWEASVTKMNKTFGAAIPEDTTQKILRYLQAHYTPETRKQ